MAVRSYLSIGDVLELLRDEFSDITISKIRFLESQGLVNPERTPAGYRKFYDTDVARLRWVLRQQKEHFLPLKVIKDRMEREWGVPGGAEPVGTRAGELPQEELWGLEEGVLGDAEAASSADARLEGRSDHDDAASSDTRPGVLEGGRQSAARVDGQELLVEAEGAEVARAAVGGAADAMEPEVVEVAGAARPRPGEADVARAGAGSPAAGGSLRTGVGSVKLSSGEQQSERRSSKRPRGARAASERSWSGPAFDHDGARAGLAHHVAEMSGVSLTLAELASSSGLLPETVSELEAYGLLSGMVIAGTTYYDEDALTVARLSAAFRRFGLEARHLRAYKNAADMEAGMVLQLLTPLLKQRNPDSRQRALEALSELSRLGQEMHSALMRAALSPDLKSTRLRGSPG